MNTESESSLLSFPEPTGGNSLVGSFPDFYLYVCNQIHTFAGEGTTKTMIII